MTDNEKKASVEQWTGTIFVAFNLTQKYTA